MTTRDTAFLAKSPTLEVAQDYSALRRQGLERLEQLAHRVWTDFNLHDPGVTLLELFCFALTELGYRGGYEMVDLLTETVDGVAVNRGDFHTAREILSSAPVSFSDLRKLLVDIHGIRNAWIEPHREVWHLLDRDRERLVPHPAGPSANTSLVELGGLFDVFVEAEDFVVEGGATSWPLGLEDDSAGGAFIDPSPGGHDKGMRFDVLYELTLLEVRVQAQRDGEIEVRLRDAAGRLLASRRAPVHAGGPSPVPLGFRIPPGRGYRLCAGPTDPSEGVQRLFRTPAAATEFPYSLEPVIRLLGGDVAAEDPIEGPASGLYYFFYGWRLGFVPDPDLGDPGLPRPEAVTSGDVRAAVLDRLHTRRSLGQDLICVREIETEEIGVCADIVLAPEADVEETLAEIFYRVELHISPPVRFYSLQEMQQRGRTTEEIFAGPRLLHGFIDDEEWESLVRPCELRASDILRLILDVPGVLAIDRLSLLSFADPAAPVEEPWVLPLAGDGFRAPRLAPERSKIIFLENNLPYYADRTEVERRLAEKRAARLPSKLRGSRDSELDLPIPTGVWRDVGSFPAVQEQLPAAYAVGRVRVPASASERRQAQASQLRAFLMFFEQMLTNHAAQLAHVGELFSWRGTGERSYFTQAVVGLPDLEKLYELPGRGSAPFEERLQKVLEELVETPASARDRRRRFLEHLAARHAENLGPYATLMHNLLGETAPARLLDDLRALLEDLPRVAGSRGLGHDVRFPAAAANLSGFQRRIYRLLGIRDVRRRGLAGHDLRIEPHGNGFRFVLEERGATRLTSIVCPERSDIEALLDFALDLAAEDEAWEPPEDPRALVLRCPDRTPEPIAFLAPGADLETVRQRLAEIASSEGFHVVEHLLLRPRHSEGPFLPVQLGSACVRVEDPYSFRVSIVLPSWPRRSQDLAFRRFVEDTLRAEAPAHLSLRICWISHAQMSAFERRLEAFEDTRAELELHLNGSCDAPPGRLLEAYRGSLDPLITMLSSLVDVKPTARLHDCRTSRGDRPHITLGHTSLGTV